jgi:hypothetical protein
MTILYNDYQHKDGLKCNRAYFKGTISRSEVPNSPFFGGEKSPTSDTDSKIKT